jgi:hypothetical protein
VKIEDPAVWGRTTELAVLSLVFLAPLAAHGSTFDPSALRIALAESAALALSLAWIMKGLARGRWEAAAASAPALAPLAALAAWSLIRFAAAPYRTASLPVLVSALACWLIFGAALLELGGARTASRLSFWTAASTALVGACGAVQIFGGMRPIAATLGGADALAAFAAAALPAVLALRLDPEAPPSRRLLSTAAAAALAFLAAWSGSARGLAFFALSAATFAASALLFLGSPAARRAALTALACAAAALAAAALGGTPVASGFAFALASTRASTGEALAVWREHPLAGVGLGNLALRGANLSDAPLARALAETGLVGAALLAWTFAAALFAGVGACLNLRRRGALAEAGYAAAFSAVFCAWVLAVAAGLTQESGPAAWLAWACAGVAAGLAPLGRPHGTVRIMPLAVGQDVRRVLQGSALSLFALLLAAPAAWLASDVRYNRAVAGLRAGRLEDALADASGAWPGSAVYPRALELRGRALLGLGRPQEALDAYARLDGVVPDFARRHAGRAEAYAALGDWAASARERASADALAPSGPASLAAWAKAARASGDLATAVRVAERAEALAPDDPAVRAELAANELMQKRLTAARDAQKRGVRQARAPKKTPR